MTKPSNSDKERRAVPWLRVDTFDELMNHEKEIVSRIEMIPNGGQLFMIHPFMLFKDIGVELSARAEQEIKQRVPSLAVLSAVPYNALKNSKERQKVRFHVHGLFERRRTP